MALVFWERAEFFLIRPDNLVIITWCALACLLNGARSLPLRVPFNAFRNIPWLASKAVAGVIFSPLSINVWSPFLGLPLLVVSFGSPRVIRFFPNLRSLIIGAMTLSINVLFLCQGLLAPRCAPEGWKSLITITTASSSPYSFFSIGIISSITLAYSSVSWATLDLKTLRRVVFSKRASTDCLINDSIPLSFRSCFSTSILTLFAVAIASLYRLSRSGFFSRSFAIFLSSRDASFFFLCIYQYAIDSILAL